MLSLDVDLHIWVAAFPKEAKQISSKAQMKRFLKPKLKSNSSANEDGGSGPRTSPSASYRPAPSALSRKRWIQDSLGKFGALQRTSWSLAEWASIGPAAQTCGTQIDDWETFLALSEVCGQDADHAKTAMKSLRSEFELGVPEARAQAARVTVILWRNSS